MIKIDFFEYVNTNVQAKQFAPNSLVLIKRKANILKDGSVKVKHSLLVVEGVVRSNKSLDMVKSLLYALLAEGAQVNEFNGAFESVNLKARKVINSFLSGANVIFKTDANGHLKQAVTSETNLNKTALNLRKDCYLFGLQGKELHTAIHRFACACMVQFHWYELLTASLTRLLDGTQEQAQGQAQEQAPKIEQKPVTLLPVAPVVDIAPVEVVVEPVKAKKQAKRQAKKQAQAK